jgi:hypothetical protein
MKSAWFAQISQYIRKNSGTMMLNILRVLQKENVAGIVINSLAKHNYWFDLTNKRSNLSNCN